MKSAWLQVLQGLSTYKLTPEQGNDNSLDLLTGKILDINQPLCLVFGTS